MDKYIDKAVIPAAGLGKRLKPITGAVPKEMFPIGRYPAIEWVIDEAIASGCTDITVIISPCKKVIQDYLLMSCPELKKACRLRFLIQEEPRGLGHALLMANDFIKSDPFAVLLPDDLVHCPQLPLLQLYCEVEEKQGAVFALTKEPADIAMRFGRLKLKRTNQRVFRVTDISQWTTSVNKASYLCGVGRYIFFPESLANSRMIVEKAKSAEIDDTHILLNLIETGGPVHGVLIEGHRCDISTSDGYMSAWRLFNHEIPKCRYL